MLYAYPRDCRYWIYRHFELVALKLFGPTRFIPRTVEVECQGGSGSGGASDGKVGTLQDIFVEPFEDCHLVDAFDCPRLRPAGSRAFAN